MSALTRLDHVLKDAATIQIDRDSRIVLFSDVHRNDRSWADDFAPNQLLYYHALRRYYDQGFTYIELGDGDELWETRLFEVIRRAYGHIYELLHDFYAAGRLFLLFGNHDMQWQDPHLVERLMTSYYDERYGIERPLFPGIRVHEGLVLDASDLGGKLFLIHGHQAEAMVDGMWTLRMLMVRHLWRHLQLLGIPDPTSPAQRRDKQKRVERRIAEWIARTGQAVICGHTHRPRLATPDELPYFNTGSCVHPRGITAIEILEGCLQLVKWELAPDSAGYLKVTEYVMAGPYALEAYFQPKPKPHA